MSINSATVDKEDVERFSRISEEWWDEHGKFKPLHRINPIRIQYIKDKTCEHFSRDTDSLKSFANLTLLDIGCGGGLIAEPFSRMGANVTAIDASDKNINVAKHHAEQTGLTIDYRNTSAENLVAETEKTYDIVLALEIVEHVADVPLFITSCVNLVKPGGLLFMSTLNRTVKSYAFAIVGAEYILKWLPRGTHDWQKFLKPSELCAQLRAEDMNINHMTGMAFNPMKNKWYLDDNDLNVNYLLTAQKKALV